MQSGNRALTTTTTTSSQTLELEQEPETILVLHPSQENEDTGRRKRVGWSEDTVDNEDMNKKKSKCCCIFEKRKNFGESDSDTSDDECEHCFGHVEKKKEKRQQRLQTSEGTTTSTQTNDSIEPTVAVTLKPPENGKDDAHDNHASGL